MQRVLAVMVVIGLAGACSGDDDGARSTTTSAPTVVTTTEPPATTAAATTVPTTTSTEPPATTTEPPPTSTGPPPPTTTEPPTATLDPLEDLDGSIQRDLTAGNEVLQYTLADPSVSKAEEQLDPYFSGQALDFVLELIEAYRVDDLMVLPNAEIPPSIEVVGAPVLVAGSEPPAATVTVCQIDSGILTAPAVGSDLRVPINDDIVRVVAVVTVELVDGVWRMSNGGVGDEQVGESSCDQL